MMNNLFKIQKDIKGNLYLQYGATTHKINKKVLAKLIVSLKDKVGKK